MTLRESQRDYERSGRTLATIRHGMTGSPDRRVGAATSIWVIGHGDHCRRRHVPSAVGPRVLSRSSGIGCPHRSICMGRTRRRSSPNRRRMNTHDDRMAPSRLSFLPLPLAAMDQLIAGDLPAASALTGVWLTPFVLTENWLWAIRAEQIRRQPESVNWVARIAVGNGLVVGHGGFHGPPSAGGMVEVAYAVDPVHRGKSHAKSQDPPTLRTQHWVPEGDSCDSCVRAPRPRA
jgi:hypothetical protein